ncbi:HEAT repeat domain-containing protein [Ancylobacter lacus]|uniref:HEAT repeat domain-containing protein n=1 Tax=Ancylobacter lacus TaxID=2579970 RepID=UPI001BCC984B|nr:HEAT repeat domain-containing protein [Ancylobacter lacus]MBS7539155.1 HEAT repeat domain-containing protein [Ancylobacter lacus]
MPLIRPKAAGAPASSPDPRTAPDVAALKAALQHGTPDARRAAARALAGVPEAAGLLAAALAGEEDIRVREAIFTGLAGLGTGECADLLLALLRSPDAGLRGGALDALAAMPARLPARLPALLRDDDPDVRLLACGLARVLASDEATALMCAVLEREAEPNVCAAAVDVLAELGEPQALPVLARCAARPGAPAFLVFATGIAMRRIRAASDRAGEAGA